MSALLVEGKSKQADAESRFLALLGMTRGRREFNGG